MSIEDNNTTIEEMESALTGESVTVYNQDDKTGRSIGIRFLFEDGHGSDILDLLGVFYRDPEALMEMFNTVAMSMLANEDASVIARVRAVENKLDDETVQEEN